MALPKRPSYYNCYVTGCTHSILNYKKSFFTIPSDSQRRNLWLKLMKREDLKDTTSKRARVCEDHFSPTSVKRLGKRTLLLKNANPELSLPIPDQFETETQTEPDDITLCVCDLQINYQMQTLIKSHNYIVKSFTKLTDPHEGDSSSGTNESKAEGRASTCKTTRLIPLLKRAEDLIISVYNYLQVEYEQLKSSIGTSCDLSPLANILQRTAAATGVSEQAVSAILWEKERAADEELLIDASDAKRAKLMHDLDGNVSPITDDESSCEAPDEEQGDITEQDNENEQDNVQTCDESQEPEETLKMEIKEEENDGPSDPLQLHISESSPGVVRVISIEPMTSLATVKTEPDDDPPDSVCDTTASDVKLEPPS